eukprot:4428379-Amphidinium_carterae.1
MQTIFPDICGRRAFYTLFTHVSSSASFRLNFKRSGKGQNVSILKEARGVVLQLVSALRCMDSKGFAFIPE